jgi:phosphatidylglycerophosphatase A
MFYKRFVIFCATGAYSGYFPKAPGTAGTLLGIPLLLLLTPLDYQIRAGLLLLLFFFAVWVSSEAARMMGAKDPSSIVIDEIVGFLVASFFIPVTALNILFIFLLFRFFDIVKPFPVGNVDRGVGGGFGIVLDDVAAGIYGAVVFALVALLFS